MDYIDKLNLQIEEVKEVENLEKHTIINNNPFSVDKYIGHTREFLAIDGEYNDGFNKLNETIGMGISCYVSKELRDARTDVNGNIHTKLKDRLASDFNEVSKSNNIATVNLLNTFRDEDCILITTNEGKSILIDCGEEFSQNGIIENIDSVGIKKLDYFIITHFHSDHAGNTETIISKYHPTNIYYKEVLWDALPEIEVEWKTKEYFDKFIAVCQRNNIVPNKVTTDISIPISKKETIKILNSTFVDYTDYNSASLMVQYNNGRTYCLFAGDVTTAVLETYKNSIPKLSLYKCAHHGGYRNNVSENFITQTRPKISHINGEGMDYSKETADLSKWACNGDIYVCGEYGRGTFGYIITDIGVYPSHNLKKINYSENMFEYKGDWYICNSVGDLVQEGIVAHKGNLCYVQNWIMVVNPCWISYNGYDYYIDETGYILCNGWKQSEDINAPDRWYYLGNNGRMLKNTQKMIGTKIFTFDEYGIAYPSPYNS